MGRQVDMYIYWPVCGVYMDMSTSSLPEFTLRRFIYMYKDVLCHAGLLSSMASVKAIYEACILL